MKKKENELNETKRELEHNDATGKSVRVREREKNKKMNKKNKKPLKVRCLILLILKICLLARL